MVIKPDSCLAYFWILVLVFKKCGKGLCSWIHVDTSGHTHVMQVDKFTIMRKYEFHARGKMEDLEGKKRSLSINIYLHILSTKLCSPIYVIRFCPCPRFKKYMFFVHVHIFLSKYMSTFIMSMSTKFYVNINI